MSKKSRSNILSLLARTGLAFLFVFGQTAQARQGNGKNKPASSTELKSQQAQANVPTEAPAKAQSAEEGTETPAAENPSSQKNKHRGDQREGIKVHGHWIIEVRNPDGVLATHREFENSFQGAGAIILASILAGAVTTGPWEVLLASSTFSGPSPWLPANPSSFDPSGGSCIIVPSTLVAFAPPGASFFPNLTVSNSRGQLVLTGSAIAAQNGGIGEVFTFLGSSCANSTTPLSCAQASPTSFQEFTAAILSPSQIVQVTAGQTVAVTVNISFS